MTEEHNFWKMMKQILVAESIDEKSPASLPPLQKLHRCRYLFQSGVVLIINNEIAPAVKQLLTARAIYDTYLAEIGSTEDHIRHFVSKRLLYEEPDLTNLISAINLLQERIKFKAIKTGKSEIYNSVLETGLFDFDSESKFKPGQNQVKTEPDKYDYEHIADEIFLLARLYTLTDSENYADILCNKAEELYNVANKEIRKMLVNEESKWSKFFQGGNRGRKTRQRYKDEYQLFLKRREELNEHIPFYRKQIEMLKFLLNLRKQKYSTNSTRHAIDDLIFRINNRKEPDMNFFEEIIWFLIIEKLNPKYFQNQDLRKILQQNWIQE
ncbi:MAG: hypothetical protein ACLFQV_03015 [Vulcanimicrobiota bacterium]